MNNKRKKAAALKYKQHEDKAPKVVSKGKGVVAEQIIKRAKEAGIYIKEDSDLVEALLALDINEEIPPILYKVVAELLVELYNINQSLKNKND